MQQAPQQGQRGPMPRAQQSPPPQQQQQQAQGAPLLQHPSQQQQQQTQQHPQGGLLPHPQQHYMGPPPPGMQQQHPHGGFPPQQPPPQGFAPPHGHPQQFQQQFQQHQQQMMQQQMQQMQQFQQGPPPPQQLLQQPPPPPQQQEHDPFLSHVVSASLVDLLGKQTLVLLRDGRKLIGELLSFDQYSNIVLSGTVERKVVGSAYIDEPLGLYVIRGENVVLLGDQHPSRPAKQNPPVEFRAVSKEEFATLEAEDKAKRAASGKKQISAEEDFDA